MNKEEADFQVSEELTSYNTHPLNSATNLAALPDRSIWRAFKKGEEKALTYIYEQYADKMYNYGCQLCQNQALVRDCIQELFVELISKKTNLGDTDHIKFYLFKSLRRKILRTLKRENLYVSDLDASQHSGFQILEDSSIKFIHQEFQEHQKTIIARECNELPYKQREALLLYFYEGMSYQQIAQTMGMTRTKSARALIYRALDSLSARLRRYKEFLYPLWPALLFYSFF